VKFFCEDPIKCESKKPTDDAIFPFFGSITITILLIGALPCLVATGITTAIVSYCKKSSANSKKEHTKPITVYQNIPYEQIPLIRSNATVAVYA